MIKRLLSVLLAVMLAVCLMGCVVKEAEKSENVSLEYLLKNKENTPTSIVHKAYQNVNG